MGATVELREFDGQRSVSMTMTAGLVFLEAGGHTYAFDTAMALKATKKLFNISVILGHGDEIPVS